MSLEERIAGRKDAEEFLILVVGGSDDYCAGVANAMRAYADEVLGKAESGLRVMSDQEAEAFERERIQFGKHLGSMFRHVPISYLAFVADSANKIASYLRSDRGIKRAESSICD